MDNNNQNLNTGSKGVFPGSNPNNQSVGTSTPGIQNQNNQPILNHTVEQQALNIQPTPNPVQGDQSKTYLNIETLNENGELTGILEMDLILYREKGVLGRYLSIKTIGAGENGGESRTAISIDKEADFNRFKKFISELNWNG